MDLEESLSEQNELSTNSSKQIDNLEFDTAEVFKNQIEEMQQNFDSKFEEISLKFEEKLNQITMLLEEKFAKNLNKVASNSSLLFGEMELNLEVSKLKVDHLANQLQSNNRNFNFSIKENNLKLENLAGKLEFCNAKVEFLKNTQIGNSERIDEVSNALNTTLMDIKQILTEVERAIRFDPKP